MTMRFKKRLLKRDFQNSKILQIRLDKYFMIKYYGQDKGFMALMKHYGQDNNFMKLMKY